MLLIYNMSSDDENKERDERHEYEYESDYEVEDEDEDEDEEERNSENDNEAEAENEEEELLFIALNRIREQEEEQENNTHEYNDPEEEYDQENTNEEFDPYQTGRNNTIRVNYTDYNNMYDLYNIHSSNEQLYRDRDISTNSNMLLCPICDERYNIENMTSHIIYNHYDLYISLNMIVNPSLTINDIHNNVNNINNITLSRFAANLIIRNETLTTAQRLMFSNDDEYTPSYEDLLSLCEQIGYHKSGIKNMDMDVPHLEEEDRKILVKDDDTCRICLECLNISEKLRKTKKCNHIFCSPCIEKWLEENKSCPLCNTELSSVDEEISNAVITNTNTNTSNSLDSLD